MVIGESVGCIAIVSNYLKLRIPPLIINKLYLKEKDYKTSSIMCDVSANSLCMKSETETESPDNINTQSEIRIGVTTGVLIWAIFNGSLFVLILSGNLLTIIAVRTCRNLRSVISNLFILSLAVSDVIVGLALLYHVAFYMGLGLSKSRSLCLLRFFLLICGCCVSILTLISIAIDRYIAIIYALHYNRFMTRRVACLIISINWFIGTLIALIPTIWNQWSTAKECEFDEVLTPWYVAGIITPGFIIIWFCMLTVYWRIMREASKQAFKCRQSIVFEEPCSGMHTDWKSVQIVVCIMGCFTICWMPFFVVAIAQLFHSCRSTSLLYRATVSLAMTNSALNPIIYSWKNTNFRKTYAQMLCCCSAKVCCSVSPSSQLPTPSPSNEQRSGHLRQIASPPALAETQLPPALQPCCDTNEEVSLPPLSVILT